MVPRVLYNVMPLEGGDLIKIAQLGEINMRAAIAVGLHV
jgi:hypothetical protein